MATKAKPAPRKKVNAPKASRSASKGAPKAAQKRPAVKKPAPKKAPAKKNAAKKPAARKPVAKQAAPKKAAARKPVTKKAAAKKPAAKKPAAKQAVTKKLSATKAPARKPAPKAAPAVSAKSGKSPRAFRPEELASFRAMLQKQLELVQGNLNALANDNLKRSPLESTGDISSHSTHMADHGTDNFDRELALSLASSRQDSLYDIEDAIRRIDEGEYGSCEWCGNPIERPRLKALPFAKKCLACQSASERGRGRFQPFRSSSHVPANAPDDTPEPSDS